jgi:hypothetical protein
MALYAFDGSWNSEKDAGLYNLETNVTRFVKAYCDHTFVYAGSGNRHPIIGKILGGALSVGGQERINCAKSDLSGQFRRGDQEIDIVGFSRGAALAMHFAKAVSRDGVIVGGVRIRPQIRFLGLWELVAAFGVPIRLGIESAFLNLGYRVSLPTEVRACYHALALDEARQKFRPTRILNANEVWFRGVHFDVGGGNNNLSLNELSLRWMLRKAIANGLPILAKSIESSCARANANGRIGDNFDPIRNRQREPAADDHFHYSVIERPKHVNPPAHSERETEELEFLPSPYALEAITSASMSMRHGAGRTMNPEPAPRRPIAAAKTLDALAPPRPAGNRPTAGTAHDHGSARQLESLDPVSNARPHFLAHPRLDVERPAILSEPVSFTVGFSLAPDACATEQSRIQIDAPRSGETVLVIVTAEGATVEDPSFVELPLELAAEHRFTARVSPNALRLSLRASYLFRNKPVGHIVRDLPLSSGVENRNVTHVIPESPTVAHSLRDHVGVADIDVVLYVQKGVPGRLTWHACAGRSNRVHGPFTSALEDAQQFAKTLAGLRRDYGDTGSGALEGLRVIGQQIAAIIPPQILNDVLGPALQGSTPPSILIMTDEPFVPWELALFPPRISRKMEPGTLGELARVGRWWTGASLCGPSSARRIENMSAVAASEYALDVPYETLEHATQECEWLLKTYGARRIEAKYADIERWLDISPRLTGHLGHLALHGFSDTTADSQGLILTDGRLLTPNRLAGVYFEGDTPRFEILFLNACQVGTAGERLGRIAGFPGALLAGGASGFIAPLWEVDDAIAHRFARQFYERVFDRGEEVGEVLRAMRSAPSAKESITPWAYLFYGHPGLTLTLAH